jgi:hypothetical protein
MAEGEGVGAAGAFVGDGLDGGKVRSRFFHEGGGIGLISG